MIYIFGGDHCDEKLYKRLIRLFGEIKPDLICIEELTHDDKVIKACNDLIGGKISLDKFKKLTGFEEYWFKFAPYKELFSYLQKNKIKIYPIDHKLKERIKLIKFEKKILEEIKKGKNISDLKEKEEKISVFDREKEMVVNINKGIKKFKSKNICVIIGGNHTDRVGDVLVKIGYKVSKKNISNIEETERYLNRMYKYAVSNKVAAMKIPPLVPIFVEVFRKINKIGS